MGIDYYGELQRYLFKPIEHKGEEWINVPCPYSEKHEDIEPSLGINIKTGVFHCLGCGTKGGFAKLLARKAEVSVSTVQLHLDNEYGLPGTKNLNIDKIEKACEALQKHEFLLKELRDRGIDLDLVIKHRLGESRDRIQIPIPSADGLYRVQKSYRPGAKKKKFITLGVDKACKIYPIDQLEYKQLVLCGGELKALAVETELNAENIGAISLTCGETSTHSQLEKFAEQLKGKTKVWVCFDVDDAGVAAANKAASMLRRLVDWVGVLDLRKHLDVEKFPKGDISDYVGLLGQKLFPLLESVPGWVNTTLIDQVPAIGDIRKEDLRLLPIEAVQNPKYTNEALNVKALVAAVGEKSYVVPSRVRVQCDRAQQDCINCSTYPLQVEVPEVQVPKGSIEILEIMGAGRKIERSALKGALGIPEGCNVVTFDPTEVYKVEEVILNKPLDLSSTGVTTRDILAVSVTSNGEMLEANQTYQLMGRPVSNPNDHSQVFLAEKFDAIDDSLATFEPDYNILKSYPVEELLQNLSEHVTRIYKRDDLHLLIDLAYHSPLCIKVEGRIEKATVEVLIVGDTSQGKSEITKLLQEYYGVGDKMDCSNSSRAGILGGLEQRAGRGYFQVWGVIPRNDRGIVILEEFGRLDPECISQLTDMRSTGIAELTKIKRGKTHARTRLICVGNPAGNRKHIGDFAYGMEALFTVLSDPAELRRFDACMTLAHTDLEGEDVHLITPDPNAENPIPRELYRQLILWAWTREPEQIIFKDYPKLKLLGKTLSDKYCEDVPIIDKGSINLKIAKLSASLACRTFSHMPDDKDKVLVSTKHVEYIVAFLDRIYSAESFGYDRYSESMRRAKSLGRTLDIEAELDTDGRGDLHSMLLNESKITLGDIEDYIKGGDRDDAKNFIGELRRCNAIKRVNSFYVKTPAFIKFLKKFKPKVHKMPEHLKGK